MRTNPPRERADDDDEWYEEDHHGDRIGSATGASGEDRDGPIGWLYYPDLSSQTGWRVWDVPRDKPSPPRPIGFTIRATNRGDPGYSSEELERDARSNRTRRGDPGGDHHRRTRNG